MIRVILPVAVIAALLLAPMFSEVTSGTVTGDTVTVRSGNYFVANTIDCFLDRNFSISGDCEPKGGLQGKFIFGAVFVSAVAAVLGILGLIPVIGRVTSFITTLAGVVVIAAIGFFLLNMMGSKEGLEGVQWGSYLAGGGGLLTLVSGLSGMRGR
ncbi:MAG: hypothetical protein VX640_13225 [Pseudomonadota bacterium]|nr:hypothetical protein [Pseudomonadota bacterium]